MTKARISESLSLKRSITSIKLRITKTKDFALDNNAKELSIFNKTFPTKNAQCVKKHSVRNVSYNLMKEYVENMKLNLFKIIFIINNVQSVKLSFKEFKGAIILPVNVGINFAIFVEEVGSMIIFAGRLKKIWTVGVIGDRIGRITFGF